ncbi:MAG: hypothetical protein SGI72_18480 [Planctomycetota bacterium]|nr:hypothetical protein [Planctomycetota bacterium]
MKRSKWKRDPSRPRTSMYGTMFGGSNAVPSKTSSSGLLSSRCTSCCHGTKSRYPGTVEIVRTPDQASTTTAA